MSALAKHQEGKQTNMKHIIGLYLLGPFLAGLMAVIASFLFPITLTLTQSTSDITPPSGIGEVLNTLMMNLVANPVDALVNAAQTTGLFGLRAEPKDLSERLVSACRQAGLFTMSRCTDDPNTLAELIRKGVNFIETRRPDITAALLPAGEAEPHGIPLRY